MSFYGGKKYRKLVRGVEWFRSSHVRSLGGWDCNNWQGSPSCIRSIDSIYINHTTTRRLPQQMETCRVLVGRMSWQSY